MKSYTNVPGHVLISLAESEDHPDRLEVIEEIVKRFKTSTSLINEILNIVTCDKPEQEVITNDMVIQLEEVIR
jgi:hypothetical protein